ncbi:MAG TPA: hypothetical protein VLV83_08200 [Acidobacteriota bacterium]|nr:hypothetical protein [Acidobacteriota bacterium]
MSSKSENAKSYTERAAAEPTDLHREFAAWIEEKTGQKVDLKSIQLACTLRMEFQASPENQSSLKDRKAAAAKRKADAAKAKKARLEAQLLKLQAELAKGDESAEGGPTAATKAAVKATAKKAPSSPRKATAAKASEKAPTQPRAARKAAPKAAAPKVTPGVPEDFDRVDDETQPAKVPARRTRRTPAKAAK